MDAVQQRARTSDARVCAAPHRSSQPTSRDAVARRSLQTEKPTYEGTASSGIVVNGIDGCKSNTHCNHNSLTRMYHRSER